MKNFFSLVFLLSFFSCATQQTPPITIQDVTAPTVLPIETPAIPSPIVIVSSVIADKDCAPKTWDSDWDKIILNSLSTKEALKNYRSDPKFYVAFMKALAKAESCLNQTERYVEKGLGKDAVTGTQNTSEGLLQLSYQDAKFHGCGFDWSKDKLLSVTSKDKTIFNPKLNLECGMIILNKQVEKKGVLLTEQTPYYWAVLNKANARYKEFKRYLTTEGF